MQNQADQSYLTYNKDGSASSFVGPDAVEMFRAFAIAQALRLYAKTGMQANRAYTPTAMLKAASSITGKKYKRGQYVQAADDLTIWGQEMKAALPIKEQPGSN